MRGKRKVLSRAELYALVWDRPMQAVAKEFGISDVGLAKICRRADVPYPGRGYWAKRAAGKATLEVPLPPRGLGESDDIHNGRGDGWNLFQSDEDVLQAPPIPAPSFAGGLPEITARAQEMLGRVTVPNMRTKAHRSVAKLLEEDQQKREKQASSPYPLSWDKPIIDSPLERRRLRIVNALFLALERCNCRPSISGREARDLSVQVGKMHISLKIEPSKGSLRRLAVGSVKSPRASERLRLEISSYLSLEDIPLAWEDRQDSTLEAQIAEMAVGILVAGEWAYRRYQINRHERDVECRTRAEENIRRARAVAERAEQKRLLKIEQDRRDQLLQDAMAWRQAAELRAYVEAVRMRYRSDPSPTDAHQVETWAGWALTEADRIDPCCRPEPPVI